MVKAINSVVKRPVVRNLVLAGMLTAATLGMSSCVNKNSSKDAVQNQTEVVSKAGAEALKNNVMTEISSKPLSRDDIMAYIEKIDVQRQNDINDFAYATQSLSKFIRHQNSLFFDGAYAYIDNLMDSLYSKVRVDFLLNGVSSIEDISNNIDETFINLNGIKEEDIEFYNNKVAEFTKQQETLGINKEQAKSDELLYKIYLTDRFIFKYALDDYLINDEFFTKVRPTHINKIFKYFDNNAEPKYVRNN